MKVATSALTVALAISAASGFTYTSTATSTLTNAIHQQQQQQRRHITALQSSLKSKPGAIAIEHEDINSEIASGKVLKGGKVIDFEAVKASSRAEEALQNAKNLILEQTKKDPLFTAESSEILGINEEVIAEVGHELAAFASKEEVQKCASYIRSKAAPGLFRQRSDQPPAAAATFSSDEQQLIQSIIRKAYEESGEVTSAFAKTFYLGTQVLPEASREAIWAIYVWCRRTDEIVDAPRDNDEEMLTDLGSWEMRLENLWKYGDVVDVYDLCMLDVLVKYPTLPITPFMDMVRGMLMDVPDLGQNKYETFDELHLYCYRVAGTVGLMSLPVFGCAQGITEDVAREPALSLGVAFQLTNILRDVGEDAKQRGRIYLPADDLKQFGVTEEQIIDHKMDQNYVNMMKFQIERARMYYQRARRGVFMLAPESRLPVQLSLDAYGAILEKIEANGYDTLTTRAYVGKWEKLSYMPYSWYRTLDISKNFPLPGDERVLDE